MWLRIQKCEYYRIKTGLYHLYSSPHKNSLDFTKAERNCYRISAPFFSPWPCFVGQMKGRVRSFIHFYKRLAIYPRHFRQCRRKASFCLLTDVIWEINIVSNDSETVCKLELFWLSAFAWNDDNQLKELGFCLELKYTGHISMYYIFFYF